jgi:hypothetical protein
MRLRMVRLYIVHSGIVTPSSTVVKRNICSAESQSFLIHPKDGWWHSISIYICVYFMRLDFVRQLFNMVTFIETLCTMIIEPALFNRQCHVYIFVCIF